MQVLSYTVQARIETQRGDTIMNNRSHPDHAPDSALIISITDPNTRRHAAAWVSVEGFTDDLRAQVIGTSLLAALDRAKPPELDAGD
jgi:hypothetical protein